MAVPDLRTRKSGLTRPAASNAIATSAATSLSRRRGARRTTSPSSIATTLTDTTSPPVGHEAT
ncbi:MAG: hypothetical protein M3083_02810 [Actinomycetota bacterium]|nr:hypothetical protein [Actinomycetota bacterium]